MIKLTIIFVCINIFGAGCQKNAAVPPLQLPPMGATTYNDELKKELLLLDKLIHKTLDPKLVTTVREALLVGKTKNARADKSDEDYLARVYLALPELVHAQDISSPTDNLWYQAKLLFLRRRFIEAASLMSEILKIEPTHIQVRNWRARAIFFLGNPDLAVSELNIIINQVEKKSEAHLDALYLIGAIIFESNDLDKKRINTGIKAWKEYLALSDPEIKLQQEILTSLAELSKRLSGQEVLSEFVDIFLPSPKYSAQKNAILKSFKEEELLLALKLCDEELKNNYDKDLAIIKARIYMKSGRIDEAALLFEQIVQKDKTYAPGFHYRGMAYMMKGMIKEAINSWQETLKLDAAYARAHNLEQRVGVAQNMLQK